MSRIQVTRAGYSQSIDEVKQSLIICDANSSPELLVNKTKQTTELEKVYKSMTEELDIVVDSVDEVLTTLQTSIREDTLQEAQIRALKLSGSFTGKFVGDGRGLKNIRWENIVGKKNRPGAGGFTFLQNPPSVTGSLVKETFLTFFDSQPAIGIIREQPFSIIECEPEGRKQLDLTNYIQARISVQVVNPGISSSVVGFQFSTDGGSTFTFLDGVSGPTASLASTGSMSSLYVTLASSAMDDILIRWVLLGGNGLTSPAIGAIILGLR